MEHRWGERFRLDIAIRVATRQFATRAGRLVDLSLSGACIQAPLDLRPLTRVQVALLLPRRPKQATPVISAYVTRISANRIGVEWCEFAPQAVVELLRSNGAPRSRSDRGQQPDMRAPAPATMSLRRGWHR
jgi:hypothetical protein